MSDYVPLLGLTLSDLDRIFSQSEFEEIDVLADVTSSDNVELAPAPPLSPPNSNENQPKKRFGVVDPNSIAQFIENQENENTKKKTKSAMKLFNQFLAEQGETRSPEELNYCELDQLFGNFITVVKKPDNSDYEPSTIRGFVCSLERHLRSKNYAQNINRNPLFPHSNNAIKAKMVHLKAQGLGSKPNESDELTDQDINKLFECGQLGVDNPYQIVNLLHVTFSLVMGMRGGKEQHDLKWGDMELCVDEDGDEYLQHVRERTTKTRTGADPKDTRKFKPKAYNQENRNRCPVTAYKIFAEQRPEPMKHPDSPFFLSINHKYAAKPNSLMFKNCPMGINHIYGLVKSMMQKTEDTSGRKITNHSVRKHLVQKCNDMGLEAHQTIQISGHKNIGSINTYSRMNDKQQKCVAAALTETDSLCPPTTAQIQNNTQEEECTGALSVSKFTQQRNAAKFHAQPKPRSTPSMMPPHQSLDLPSTEMSPPGNIQYSQQASRSSTQMDMQTVFQGTTIIHGGTFNFYGINPTNKENELSQSEPPKRKYRRILPVISDDDSD